jgi:hypothetical protein
LVYSDKSNLLNLTYSNFYSKEPEVIKSFFADFPTAQFPTTLTTWSNLGNNRQQSNSNNNNNNNEDEEDEESSPAPAKSVSTPEMANNARLTAAFMRKRDLSWEASEAEAADPNAIPMMRSKVEYAYIYFRALHNPYVCQAPEATLMTLIQVDFST